jgi:elongation factor G
VKEMLGSHALPLQINIGEEDNFKGVVDLINFKGIVWNENDFGMTFKEVEIPADIIDEARRLRSELLEAVAEFDESLMEKFFEDENSLTEREILNALRASYYLWKSCSNDVWFFFQKQRCSSNVGHGNGNFTFSNGC